MDAFRGIALLLASLAVVSVTRTALADSMRCGHRIVQTGDSLHEVRSLCGEPAAARQRFETRTELRRVVVDCGSAKRPHRRCERVERVSREVRIDEWIYDFGPRRFIQYLTFADGWLERVEAGGRGRAERAVP
jgi:hypothetical protein